MNAISVTRMLRSGVAALLFAAIGLQANAQSGDDKYQPQVGQSGKDVVWVPTPDELVRRMLEVAKVTKDDLLFDL
ncbi:MAG: SAM-dependent methyltransferase, partial [Betaproteobacteria bacterium]